MLGKRGYIPVFGEEDAGVGVPKVVRRGLLAVARDEAAAIDEEENRDRLVRGERCRVGVEHVELRGSLSFMNRMTSIWRNCLFTLCRSVLPNWNVCWGWFSISDRRLSRVFAKACLAGDNRIQLLKWMGVGTAYWARR